MGIAVVGVSLLIWLTLGWRESAIVAIAIPATLALTLLVFYLLRFHAESHHAFRADLFASAFWWMTRSSWSKTSFGIFICHRITAEAGRRSRVEAVSEVGNPTILATFAVICAVLADGVSSAD